MREVYLWATGWQVSSRHGANVSTRLIANCAAVILSSALAVAAQQNKTDSPPGMVWIPGGTFRMGSDSGHSNERPVHEVAIDGFWIDRHEVTNAQFAAFVDATGYVTVAERTPRAEDFPGAPTELLVPGSLVFTPTDHPVPLHDWSQWWSYVAGVDWRHPEGPESDIEGRENHSVVHVAWEDAVAFCEWARKRLPTEAEWEFAARGGLDGAPNTWGEEPYRAGAGLANIWTGHFPNENTAEDGFVGTAPVGSYKPNGFGLHDMAGNVWEWTADWYRPDTYRRGPVHNPTGPEESFDPNEPGIAKRVTRGGSFLCNDAYCTGYRPSARMASSPDTGLSHTGFRCAMSQRDFGDEERESRE